jgi:hypothetical protein
MIRLALALLLLAVAPAGAAETIRTGKTTVTRIGSFDPTTDPTVGAAVRAFGEPTTSVAGDDTCTADWSALRLRIVFASFGSREPGETVCSPTVGRAQTFTARGRAFRTSAGLRVGDRRSLIRRRHPAARLHGTTWWLRTATSLVGEGESYGVLRARTRSGRVSTFSGWIGAAGE